MPIKPNEIILNPDNPRTIDEGKYQLLVRSIVEFPKMMEIRPIVLDENNMVLGGNMRFLSCQAALFQLGLSEIPDSWIRKETGLTEKQKREFIIKDNLAFGEWDYDKLANEWDQEEIEHWGLSVVPKSEITDDEMEAFFKKHEEEKAEKKKVIILEYNEQDYERVLSEFDKRKPETKESIIWRLLGL